MDVACIGIGDWGLGVHSVVVRDKSGALKKKPNRNHRYCSRSLVKLDFSLTRVRMHPSAANDGTGTLHPFLSMHP